jgi:dihydroorotate dehydrogenase (fumarate)
VTTIEPRDTAPGVDPGDDPDAALGEALAGAGRVVLSGPTTTGEVDLSTRWLGLELRSPVVASSNPLTGELETLVRLDAAGVGAVVLPSLFEEQLEHEAEQVDRYLGLYSDANPEATYGYAPVLDGYNRGADRYLQLVRDAKNFLDVPVVASLNGATPGGWIDHARMIADAGADAIELNVHQVAADPMRSGADVEAQVLEVVASVVEAAGVPVGVKLSPHWSSLANLAMRLAEAGAAGLSLFNRFYRPDIDLEGLRVDRRLSLSEPRELGLPLLWIGLLRDRLDVSLAATSGVHAVDGALKALLVGADVTMMASALLRNGPEHVAEVTSGLRGWMQRQGYGSVRQLIGSMSQASVLDPSAFERANYIDTLTRFASTFRP